MFFPLNFGWRRVYANFIIKVLQSRKCMYLWATLSHLDPSRSWGLQWKSPGQHRRTTLSHTLLPNSVWASKATLQTQQCFGLEQVWWFLSLMKQRSRRLQRVCVFTTSITAVALFGVHCSKLFIKKGHCAEFACYLCGFSPGIPGFLPQSKAC